jgi:hypothetical protein
VVLQRSARENNRLFDIFRMHPQLASQLPGITALCERYGVAHLEPFGSARLGSVIKDADVSKFRKV